MPRCGGNTAPRWPYCWRSEPKMMTLTSTSARLCQPRFATPRSPERLTFGPQIIEAAKWLGTPLMGWQEQVAMVGGEIDPETGLPAYREVAVTVPRQSGKTTLILAWELQRARGWEHHGPQRIVYSAQNGNAARRKLIDDQAPLLQRRKAKLGIARILRGMGNEAVEFRNSSRIELLASLEDSGHGKTVDLGVKDELFADTDLRRDQALIPAMATRDAGQMITASTMGTSTSVALNRLVERARQAVEVGQRSGIAYFEWSAEPDADPDDPEVWRGCMPALGRTISEPVVRAAREQMLLSEFRRAFLNITDDHRSEPIIPAAAWRACGGRSVVLDPVSLAVDITPDRSWGAIGAAGANTDGRVHVEVADHRPGTGWIVDRLVELRDRHSPKLIVLDPAGPAASLLNDLTNAGVEVRPVSLREHAQACGAFYDDVIEGRLRHIGQPELEAAVDGADRRTLQDAWLWARRASSVDISPLVAVTLARWAHSVAEET